MLCGRIGVTFVYNLVVRKYDFRGCWSANPKTRGWLKKTEADIPEKWGRQFDSVELLSYMTYLSLDHYIITTVLFQNYA